MSAREPADIAPTDIPARVLATFAELFKMETARVALPSSLRNDIGLDSLDTIELAIALDEAFGISISEREVDSWRCVLDVVSTVEQLVAKKAS